MRILVTGSAGMLGRAVMQTLAGEHALMGVDLDDGDLERPEDVERIFAGAKPEWVIHCAAWTAVDDAETCREEALAANAMATAHVVGACREQGAGITYISTDYVFDGRGNGGGYDELDARDPVNYYGQTKAEGEEHVEQRDVPWQIVRTSWLFGDGRVNFPKTIRRLLAERETLRVVDDQRGCPTYAPDLAEVLGFLVSSGERGIFHGTNAGACTWFEFAREVAQLCGADPERIEPCDSSAYPTDAVRPPVSVLHSSFLEELGCPPRPTWQDALARYLTLLDAGDVAFP